MDEQDVEVQSMSADADSLYLNFRKRRQERGLTQSELAREANCSQSAVSMFEAGRSHALSQERLVALAQILELDTEAVVAQFSEPGAAASLVLKYCSTDECPSNIPYVVRGQLCFRPTMVKADAAEQSRCRECGDILESRCPNPACGLPAEEGSYCGTCGTAYVPVTRASTRSDDQWADEQRSRIHDIRELSKARTN